MSPPNPLDIAIIAAMQAQPGEPQRVIRKVVGATEYYFAQAVRRLRYAGKLHWDRFELSPSLSTNTQGASGTARKAPGAASSGAAKRGSASAPPINSAPPIAEMAGGADGAGGGAQPSAPSPSISLAADPLPAPRETIAERFRRLASEVDAEMEAIDAAADAEERRERDLVTLPTPSALLRRAKRDWPDQCAAVQAMAADLGITLGEAWRRTIAAGVANLRNDGEALS